jgi:hypothetical protein
MTLTIQEMKKKKKEEEGKKGRKKERKCVQEVGYHTIIEFISVLT